MEEKRNVRIVAESAGGKRDEISCDSAIVLAIKNTSDIRDALLQDREGGIEIDGSTLFIGMGMPDDIFVELFTGAFADVIRARVLNDGRNAVEAATMIHEAADQLEQCAREYLLGVSKEDLVNGDMSEDVIEAIGILGNLKDTLDRLKGLKKTFDEKNGEE